MPIQPRAYSRTDDFSRMRMLVSQSPDSGNVHIGDLNWWAYYIAPVQGHRLEDNVTLWEDEHGHLIAWIFWSDHKYDMALLPNYQGGEAEEQITLWAETQFAARPKTGEMLETFVFADDAWRCAFLEQRGYQSREYLAYFTQRLDTPLTQPSLPSGFHFLDAMSAEYAEQRADVHFKAFDPSRMTASAYRSLMEQAPDYEAELDTIIVAPDGRFAAFAMGWLDALKQMSIFEPVGTRPDMRRRGLGRAVLLEGLRRLQARGVRTATVCTHTSNAGNITFYESVGFHLTNTILSYTKQI